MGYDVFIYYSSREKPITDATCANIEATGVRCWIALHDISRGKIGQLRSQRPSPKAAS
jgi:hypothetical protein